MTRPVIQFRHRVRRTASRAAMLVCAMVVGCIPGSDLFEPINPFQDLPVIPMDGEPHALSANIAPLGWLSAGDVIRLRITEDGVRGLSILAADDVVVPHAGVIVGGGPIETDIDFRIPSDGPYYAFARMATTTGTTPQQAFLTFSAGDASFVPPPNQIVVIRFEDDYLTEPGLVDPTTFTEEERQLLRDIEPVVHDEIIATLREIFADTPIEIVDELNDPLPAPPHSVVTLSPERMIADDLTATDIAVPTTGSDSPCDEAIVFGELLPSGTEVDFGNYHKDDEAIVYVGSFQGRGDGCRLASLDSLAHIVMALSHTAAHEIGHLIGLEHVALIDIMDRRVTAAFQRELGLDRLQTLTETPVRRLGGAVDIIVTVQTNIYQDPDAYFEANFD